MPSNIINMMFSGMFKTTKFPKTIFLEERNVNIILNKSVNKFSYLSHRKKKIVIIGFDFFTYGHSRENIFLFIIWQ